MSRNPATHRMSPDDAELRGILEQALREGRKDLLKIDSLSRIPSRYSTSFAIEEIRVRLADGRTFELILKNLNKTNMLAEARRTRPASLFDPVREIAVYRSVLEAGQFGTASLIASRADRESGQFWLVLEKVPGVELFQVGDFGVWQSVAGYLARLHENHRPLIHDIKAAVPLLRYDRSFYEMWPRRALSFASVENESSRNKLEQISKQYSAVTERLLELPVTLLHGDYNASNILVSGQEENVRICPVDWEMAAMGPGPIDLAALVSGQWNEVQREALIAAYIEGRGDKIDNGPETEKLLEDLKYCQLHLAMQWLGWSESWRPPPEHQQDWLQQAVCLAAELGLLR